MMSSGHVERLLSKLPRQLKDGFVEHLEALGRLDTSCLNPYNLRGLSDWLRLRSEAQVEV